MAPEAYMSISTVSGSETEVLGELKKIPGIKRATLIYGNKGDIFASVHEETMEKLKATIDSIAKKTDKIRNTEPYVVVENDSAFSRNENGEIEKFKI